MPQPPGNQPTLASQTSSPGFTDAKIESTSSSVDTSLKDSTAIENTAIESNSNTSGDRDIPQDDPVKNKFSQEDGGGAIANNASSAAAVVVDNQGADGGNADGSVASSTATKKAESSTAKTVDEKTMITPDDETDERVMFPDPIGRKNKIASGTHIFVEDWDSY